MRAMSITVSITSFEMLRRCRVWLRSEYPTLMNAVRTAGLRMDHRPKPRRAAWSCRAFYH